MYVLNLFSLSVYSRYFCSGQWCTIQSSQSYPFSLPPIDDLEIVTMAESFEEMKIKGKAGKFTSEKQTFFCEVCNIPLNSHATMVIHMKGAKHMQKSRSLGSGVQEPGVFRIPNPEPRKKIPIKLAQKIKDSSGQYIVGLDSITEYIPVSDEGKLVLML